ncbi:hypothetical protein E2C01_067945 [Portunus trituberculatus]|uniref:Uncharacterized protein n=1 Tax=Portunus trituberculatus TaxID=210409 RepID=A0A5B7HMF8_PORTR|nr:hypothetical protein [Portunus trituberculatus]
MKPKKDQKPANRPNSDTRVCRGNGPKPTWEPLPSKDLRTRGMAKVQSPKLVNSALPDELHVEASPA